MKRIGRPLVVGVVVTALSLVLAGCGQNPAPAKEYTATIGTSGTGGTYEILGSAMAKIVNDYSAVKIKTSIENTPGGGSGNIRLLGQKQLTFGIAGTDSAFTAYQGEGEFEGTKIQNLRTVMLGSDVVGHFIVAADSKFQSLKDLKGARIVSTSAANASQDIPKVLAACGLKPEDYEVKVLTQSEAAEAFKAGQIDAILTFTSAPSGTISDLALAKNLRFLSPEPEAIAQLLKDYPYYSQTTLPAGTYKGVEEVVTLSKPTALFTHADVDTELVYNFVKAIMEHEKELAEINKSAGLFNPAKQKASFSAQPVPPLHPGAEKYYREAKLINW